MMLRKHKNSARLGAGAFWPVLGGMCLLAASPVRAAIQVDIFAMGVDPDYKTPSMGPDIPGEYYAITISGLAETSAGSTDSGSTFLVSGLTLPGGDYVTHVAHPSTWTSFSSSTNSAEWYADNNTPPANINGTFEIALPDGVDVSSLTFTFTPDNDSADAYTIGDIEAVPEARVTGAFMGFGALAIAAGSALRRKMSPACNS